MIIIDFQPNGTFSLSHSCHLDRKAFAVIFVAARTHFYGMEKQSPASTTLRVYHQACGDCMQCMSQGQGHSMACALLTPLCAAGAASTLQMASLDCQQKPIRQ